MYNIIDNYHKFITALSLELIFTFLLLQVRHLLQWTFFISPLRLLNIKLVDIFREKHEFDKIYKVLLRM